MKARFRAAAALVAAWAVRFVPFLVADGVPFYRDELLTALPLRAYLTERLRRGELPQWYPYEALGVPFIGQVQDTTFHPFTFLLLPFSPVTAIKVQLALAWLLGLAGAYRAARALPAGRAAAVTAAIAFAFGGYAFGVSHNPSYLIAFLTLPWVLWASLRLAATGAGRHLAALAAAWALVFLAGDAQEFALCPLILLAAGGWKRPARFTAAGLLTTLLVCVEFVPAMMLSRTTIRILGSSDPLLGRIFSFHPLRVFELFAPSLIPDGLRVEVTTPLFHDGGALWATTVFAGSLALLFAASALRDRRAWPFAALAAAGLLLAMGSHAGLLPLLWNVGRPLTWFRFPEKYLAFFWIGLLPLVALGFERCRWQAAAGAAAAAAMVAAGARFIVPQLFTGAVEPYAVDATVAAWRAGFLWSAGFLAAGAALLALPRARPALAALVFAELLHGNSAHLPLAPREQIEPRALFARFIGDSRVIPAAGGKARRTVTGGDVVWAQVMRQSLRPDVSGLDHLGSIGFNLPATQLRAWRALGPDASLRSRAGPIFGACFAVEDIGQPGLPDASQVADLPPLALRLAQLPCRPRATLTAAEPVSDQEAVSRLRRGLPPGMSVWEGGPSLPSSNGQVLWMASEPEHLAFEIDADQATAFVLGDQFTPGWTATLDGAPAAIYPANVAARGIAVPAGHHRVEMRYRTPGLVAGALLTLLGVLIGAALATMRRWTSG
ncbi:MAG TPA: YfhO family protein [Myxococcales bacterium]|nr:YfhO family protein [Myxococcales bacterium]